MKAIGKNRVSLIVSVLVLLAVILAALLAPLSPYDPNAISLLEKFQSPSAAHWFGTDDFGRDYFTRVLYGGRVSLLVGVLSMLVSITFGSLYGIVSGFAGKTLDALMMRLVDILMAVPSFLLIITMNIYLNAGLGTLVLTISLFSWMGVARIVRAEVLSLRERDFILASQGLGAETGWIIFHHLVKNVSSSVLVASTNSIAAAILTESSLSYLGFGISMDLEDNWQLDLGNPADVQNDLCAVQGTSWVLEEVYGEDGGSSYSYGVEQEGEYYAYISNRQVKEVKVSWGEESTTYDNVNRGYLLELGRCLPGEEILLTAVDPAGADLSARVYRFSDDALRQVYETLSRESWNLTEWTDTALAGTITMEHPGLLYTSIPYDRGWSVLVDGEEAETRKLFDTFLTVELPAGSHTVEMHYEPEGLRAGAAITAVSAGSLAAAAVLGRLAERKKKERR